MAVKLEAGMRVRITAPKIECETGTLVFYDTNGLWLVRLDRGGWSWGDGWSSVCPHIPVKDGEKGFGWVYSGFLEQPETE